MAWMDERRDDRTRFKSAAVCTRGHVEASDIELRAEVAERCSKCGARILIACPQCGHRIRGRRHTPGVVNLASTYEPPRFCDSCGTPFSWLDRQGRIYELENLLDEEDLDSADELTVREQLQALADPELSDEEARERWQRVKRLAPKLWESGKPIIDTVVGAAIKTQLGL